MNKQYYLNIYTHNKKKPLQSSILGCENPQFLDFYWLQSNIQNNLGFQFKQNTYITLSFGVYIPSNFQKFSNKGEKKSNQCISSKTEHGSLSYRNVQADREAGFSKSFLQDFGIKVSLRIGGWRAKQQKNAQRSNWAGIRIERYMPRRKPFPPNQGSSSFFREGSTGRTIPLSPASTAYNPASSMQSTGWTKQKAGPTAVTK